VVDPERGHRSPKGLAKCPGFPGFTSLDQLQLQCSETVKLLKFRTCRSQGRPLNNEFYGTGWHIYILWQWLIKVVGVFLSKLIY